MEKGFTHKLNNLLGNLKNAGNLVAEKINDALANIFYNDKLKDIAKETNFVQRSSSRIQGDEFVQAMVLAAVDPEVSPLSGINDNLREINSNAEMTNSALRQRLNSPQAQNFLKRVYQEVVKVKLEKMSRDLHTTCNSENKKGALEIFEKVLIHDSSSCALNERLEKSFKGSGGAASKSQVKIDLIYDLKRNNAEEVIITDVSEPDQSLSSRIIKHISEGVLAIQDLGYFDVGVFENIETKGGFYLSRLLSTCLVYLKMEDQKPIELGKHLKMLHENDQALDIEVYITKKKFKTRLIAYPVPEEVFNKRRREYNKKAKGTPSNELIARQQFTILITNVQKEVWSWEVVGTVYKIRWQIELIFKSWKSQLSIHYLKGINPERIRCLIYSRLIATTVIFAIYHAISNKLCPVGYELSLFKFVNWLKRNGHFVNIILRGFNSSLWKSLTDRVDLLCKDTKRKRKTTRQHIDNEIPFLNTFSEMGRLYA